MKSIEYFKTKLMQLKTNKNVIRVFQGAEKKECKNYLKKECKTVIWEDKENVRNYYHIAKGLLEQYEKQENMRWMIIKSLEMRCINII